MRDSCDNLKFAAMWLALYAALVADFPALAAVVAVAAAAVYGIAAGCGGEVSYRG